MDTGYRIGAVAKLTGISTDTIRAWERRYKVVEPNRGDNNNRYYSEEHIRKLISVKRLVDAGQAIGTVCRLSEKELQDRTNGLLNVSQSRSAGPLRKWAVVSIQKPSWLKACVSAQPGVEASWVSSLEDLSVSGFEFVIIDMPSLSEVNEKLVLRLIPAELAAKCLVVYKFASRTQLRALTARGFRLLKGPLEPFALVNLLSTGNHAGNTPNRRAGESGASNYTQGEDFLDQYRTRLSKLIHELGQLEEFSVEQHKDDLLEPLIEKTAQARIILEQAFTGIPGNGPSEITASEKTVADKMASDPARKADLVN